MHEITINISDRSGSTMRLELPMSVEKITDMTGEKNASQPSLIGGYSFRLAELNHMIDGSEKIVDLNTFA
jgi:hypothetical protein